MHEEKYSLVARKRSWVPEWMWKCFCIRIPFFGGLGAIQPFMLILTEAVKPAPHHPQCVWCEGKPHCLKVNCDDESGDVVLKCRHCSYQRPLTDKEASADWNSWDAPSV